MFSSLEAASLRSCGTAGRAAAATAADGAVTAAEAEKGCWEGAADKDRRTREKSEWDAATAAAAASDKALREWKENRMGD